MAEIDEGVRKKAEAMEEEEKVEGRRENWTGRDAGQEKPEMK